MTAENLIKRVQEPDKMRAIAYYNGLAAQYNETVTRGFLARLRERERSAILEFAKLEDPTRQTMIDVGCGGGFYALEAKRNQKTVTAMDLAPAMLDGLREKVDHVVIGDIEQTRLPEAYDIVICSGVLEFVISPEQAFENLAALMPKQGRLVIQVPRSGFGGWFYSLEKRFSKVNVNLFSWAWFEAQASRHGLHLTGRAEPLPHNMVALLLRR